MSLFTVPPDGAIRSVLPGRSQSQGPLALGFRHSTAAVLDSPTSKMPNSYRRTIGRLRSSMLDTSGPGVRRAATMTMIDDGRPALRTIVRGREDPDP